MQSNIKLIYNYLFGFDIAFIRYIFYIIYPYFFHFFSIFTVTFYKYTVLFNTNPLVSIGILLYLMLIYM